MTAQIKNRKLLIHYFAGSLIAGVLCTLILQIIYPLGLPGVIWNLGLPWQGLSLMVLWVICAMVSHRLIYWFYTEESSPWRLGVIAFGLLSPVWVIILLIVFAVLGLVAVFGWVNKTLGRI